MEYADIVIAVLGALLLAWTADQLTGRRGLFGAGLVAAVGAVCGWFLVIRVFAAATMDDWIWVLWSMGGAAVCLVAYFLFRSKR